MIAEVLKRLKNRELIILLTLVCVVVLGCLLAVKVEIEDYIPGYATHVGHEGEEQFIYYLTDNDVIVQEFTSPQDFDMVSLHFSNHDQVIQGKTFITITDEETKEIVCYEEKNNTDINFTELVEIELTDQGQADRSYILSLSFEGMGDKGLGIFGFSVTEEKSAALIGKAESEYSVAIGTHTYTTRFKTLVTWIVIVMICTLVIGAILTSATRFSEEYLFLGIAIPVGLAFLMFLSVNAVHDGGTHLAKVYHYSNALLGQGKEDVYGYVKLRSDEAQVFNEIYENRNRANNTAEVYWDSAEHFWDKDDTGEWELSHEYRETSSSSFFEYFPGILGMTIGRIFGGSARFNILLAKMFFFLFYIGMVFWAIKITPCFKTVIAFAALLPMSMYQATGITYDSIVMAVSMVVIALFFKARNKALSRGEAAALFVLAVVLGCCKGGFYLLLLLLFFTIPSVRFGGKKAKCKVCLGSLMFGAIGVAMTYGKSYLPMLQKLFFKAESSEVIAEAVSEVPNAAVQLIPETKTVAYGISYAFENMIGFIKLFCATIIQEADRYIGSLVGYRMAWTDELISWVVIFAFLGLLWMASSSTDSEQMEVTVLERILCAGILAMEVVGFHMIMLIETPVGDNVIRGVQGRYFLAWVPIIMLIIYNGNRKYTLPGKRRLFFYFSVAEAAYLYFFLKIFLGIA